MVEQGWSDVDTWLSRDVHFGWMRFSRDEYIDKCGCAGMITCGQLWLRSDGKMWADVVEQT